MQDNGNQDIEKKSKGEEEPEAHNEENMDIKVEDGDEKEIGTLSTPDIDKKQDGDHAPPSSPPSSTTSSVESVDPFLEAYIDTFWRKFDVNNDYVINLDEAKIMLMELLPEKNISSELVVSLMERLDTENEVSGDISSVLHKDDMLAALEDGLVMTNEEKHKLSKVGKWDALSKFINVVAKNMESYRAETEKGITQFLDHLWTKFDADKNGFIDASETKQILQITHKDTDVDVEDVNNFIKNINGAKAIASPN